MTEPIWGVDVHCTYQAGLDIERLAAEGYSFCIVKATEGWGGYWAPGMFDDWQRRIRASGMINGAYHWCTPHDAVGQVDYFLSRLGDHRQYPIIQLDIDKATPIETVREWVAEWNRRANRHPVFQYPEKPTSLRLSDLRELGPVWDSHYVDGSGYASVLYEKVPSDWWPDGVKILQFSSRDTAGGLTANVDADAFQGTKEQLLAIATGGTMATWSNRAKEPAPPNFPFNGETAAVDVATVLREGKKTGWSDHDGEAWWLYEILTRIDNRGIPLVLSAEDKADIVQEIKATIVNDVAEAVFERIKEQFDK